MAAALSASGLEPAIMSLMLITPRYVLENSRLLSLFQEFFERFFQRCTLEELPQFVPASLWKTLRSLHLSPASSTNPLSSSTDSNEPCSRPSPHTPPAPLPLNYPANRDNESSVALRGSKRFAPDKSSVPHYINQRARKKRRTVPKPENVKIAEKSLSGIEFLEKIPSVSIWGSTIWGSSILEGLRPEESLHTDDWELEVELPLKRCGEAWKKNRMKSHESECARRFLGLFISHFADFCESLPELPRSRRHGVTNRTYAYQIVSLETGESISDLTRIAFASKRYLQLAERAGLSRLIEIATSKSWIWENRVSEVDMIAICNILRKQHKTMGEEEKHKRSELDFSLARDIIKMLQRLGAAVSKLEELDTGLTRVLRKFVKVESVKNGIIHRIEESFYNMDEEPEDGTEQSNSAVLPIQSTGTVREAEQSNKLLGQITTPSNPLAQTSDRDSYGLSTDHQGFQTALQTRDRSAGLDTMILASDPLSKSLPASNTLCHDPPLGDTTTNTHTQDTHGLSTLQDQTPGLDAAHSYSKSDMVRQDIHSNWHQHHAVQRQLEVQYYDSQLPSPPVTFQDELNRSNRADDSTARNVCASISANQDQEFTTIFNLAEQHAFWLENIESAMSTLEEW